jgi:hypothetical protein
LSQIDASNQHTTICIQWSFSSMNIISSFDKFHPCDIFIIHVVKFMNIVSVIHVFSFIVYITLIPWTFIYHKFAYG